MKTVIASIIALHLAPLFSYGTQLEKLCWRVACLTDLVLSVSLLLERSSLFRRRRHLSHSAAWFRLKCWNKLVVLLQATSTAFWHCLQRGVVCPSSDAVNPYQIQITLGRSCSRPPAISAMLFVVCCVHVLRALGESSAQITKSQLAKAKCMWRRGGTLKTQFSDFVKIWTDLTQKLDLKTESIFFPVLLWHENTLKKYSLTYNTSLILWRGVSNSRVL